MKGVPVALLLFATACTPAAAPDEPPVASTYRVQCGRCHVPPERGTRTAPYLEDAFSRHRDRVRLSEDQWRSLVLYLAKDGG